MSVYKGRRPGTYRIVIHHGEAKPFDVVIEARTKAEADRWHAGKVLELGAQRGRQKRTLTAPRFSAFCLNVYLPFAARTLKSKTLKNRKYQLALLMDFYKDKPLDRFDHFDVIRFQDARHEAGIGGVKINDDVKVLIAILNYAATLGERVTVPQRAMKGGVGWRKQPERPTQGKVECWTEEQVNKLYAAIEAECPQLLGMTVIMINCGLRPGEALALEWSWIDLARGLIMVQPNEYWQPKNGKPREVTIGDAAMPWLSGPRQHDKWVFPTLPTPREPQGDRYTAWPQKQWDRARKRSGVGGSPNRCRHTFASHFLASKPNLVLLAEVMGHSHTKVTKLYTHFLPGYLEQTRNVVNLPAPPRTATPSLNPVGVQTMDVHGSSMDRPGRGGQRRQRGLIRATKTKGMRRWNVPE